MFQTMATYLLNAGFTDGAQMPGRPIADPGPDRTVTQGATSLSAGGSLYSTTYAWSIVSGPDGAVPPVNATLTNANSVQPTFNASVDGAYVVRLVSSQGTAQSSPVDVQLVVQEGVGDDGVDLEETDRQILHRRRLGRELRRRAERVVLE